ncbi:MAG: DegT/DnrJ/EryC1/StrS family aminotransferase, partial [Muribaculaceae bacterium]|nr:DegT/DnrJ/EryC1/StrS family aminotransferase [Muribaculaceae bacterium]
GPEIEAFENRLADYQQVRHIVGVSNGLDALRLILRGYIEIGQLSAGDEVIVPANTYIASVLAISHAGLKPVLVEPSAETLNLDTSLIESHMTERTRAIMTVHLYGRTCWDTILVETARRHNLLIIEDNAQGIGSLSTIPGLSGAFRTGSLGHAAAFSFYPTKNLGAQGDAGAVATNDTALAQTVKALANYGSDYRYHNIYQGFNCRMDPIQAAVLNVKLQYLDNENDRRRDIASLYDRLISNPAIHLHTVTPAKSTNYHQFIAVTSKRDALQRHLAEQGIGTDIHYAVPPHRQPCYREQFDKLKLPVTEQLADSVLSLPIAPYLTDKEVARIANAINRFLNK